MILLNSCTAEAKIIISQPLHPVFVVGIQYMIRGTQGEVDQYDYKK
jgi:hypothetical protein